MACCFPLPRWVRLRPRQSRKLQDNLLAYLIGTPLKRKVTAYRWLDHIDREVLVQKLKPVFPPLLRLGCQDFIYRARLTEPDFSDCSPALIASTVLSMVRPTCGITSPCTAHSIARVMPRWRNAFASSSSVAGSEK